ncbi:hypothetical protein CLV78_102382 [Aliiruegeria haliotis]|uniref:Uncharacterized protein n=1 Tax=Aliiruegeria haliotis TaxID=1280846 RepID=A0A2T0RVI3_9RHOB|nr:hypothetical protein [Aliiruegeria haliotis]PRY25205.1 hypothetical protein CLV78_102382 [Aliiruegeria haliotis]
MAWEGGYVGDWSDIEAFVERLREQQGAVVLGKRRLQEVSGNAYPGGEIALLIERQLVNTQFGYGAWKELHGANVLEAVRNYIRKVG